MPWETAVIDPRWKELLGHLESLTIMESDAMSVPQSWLS